MAEEVYLTPEERLKDLSDALISSIIKSDEDSLEKRRYLLGQLPVRVFKDENYVIYYVLHQFRDKGITPDAEFLKLYLLRNVRFLKESQSFIDLTAYADDDENPCIGYIGGVIKHFKRLLGVDAEDLSTFKLQIEKYRIEYSGIEMNKAYSQAREILYDGIQVGRHFYQGFEDSVAYVKRVAADIENMLDNSIGDGFIDSRTEAIIDKKESKPEKIGDFDLIDELNEYLGGIYTSLLYNIVAPTKGGKSKFTARLIHNIVVEHGNNMSVWAFEGGYEAWWAQLRAIHFEYMYIRNANSNEKVAPLSQADILKGDYPSEAIRSLEEASRIDLFTNPNYGEINMINRPFEVETFIEEIDTSVKVNNSKGVLVDYLQLITSSERGKKNTEIIKDAYKKALQWCKDRNKVFITPAQFKQEFIKEMSSYNGSGSPETRVSGGESSEVIRASDINIALYASLDDLARNEMTIMSIPSRLAVNYPSFKIYADLCSCVFSSIAE